MMCEISPYQGGGRKAALSNFSLTEMSQEADTVEMATDGRVEQ